ncbi:MAG TPA: pitrilysin family protein [Bacillota bacterium]|nr:pitrilysin family protein [Bacillota bacterium]
MTRTRILWGLLLMLIVSTGAARVMAAPKENFEKTVLKNGVTVMYKVMKDQPMVSMYAVFPIGTRQEKAKGIAHLLEHLVFRGGSEYTYQDIAGETIRQGGQFNGFTSFYSTSYNYVVPKENFETAFKVFNASIWKTNLTAANVDMEKKIIVYELDMDYSMQYAYYPVIRYFYPEMYHSKESMAGISVADLQAFHRSYYQPDNATYIIAGDFNPKTVFASLEQIKKTGESPKKTASALSGGLAFPRGEVVEERNLYPFQFQALMGYELDGLTAKERMVLKLLSYIYGSNWKIDYRQNRYKIYNAVTRSVGNKDYFGIFYLERVRPYSEARYRQEKENMQKFFHEFKKIDFKREFTNFSKLIDREMIQSQVSPETAVEYEVQRLTDPDNITVDALEIVKSLKEKDLMDLIDKYFSKPPTAWILVKHNAGGNNG